MVIRVICINYSLAILDPYNFIFNVIGWCIPHFWLLRTAYNNSQDNMTLLMSTSIVYMYRQIRIFTF